MLVAVHPLLPERSPVRKKALCEHGQWNRRFVLQHSLDRRSHTEAVSAGAKESRTMGGVLHRVGKGEQLLILIQWGGVNIADRNR